MKVSNQPCPPQGVCADVAVEPSNISIAPIPPDDLYGKGMYVVDANGVIHPVADGFDASAAD